MMQGACLKRFTLIEAAQHPHTEAREWQSSVCVGWHPQKLCGLTCDATLLVRIDVDVTCSLES